MYKIFIVLVIFFSYLSADEGYKLGNGVQVGSLPVYIGGYTSLDYQSSKDIDRYRVDDIALLAYGNYGKFSYLGELEYRNFYVRTDTQDTTVIYKDRRIYAERLYVDYNYDENYKFKIGKYNSPIGFWNLLPINVFRQTTSSPISSKIIFPTFTTGVSISRTSFDEDEFKIELMLQNNEDLDDEYNSYEIDKHYGLNILYEKENISFKLNGGYFHRIEIPISDRSLYYFLFSVKYESDKYQLMGEFGNQFSKTKVTTPYAGYIQGLYRINQEHIASVRFEAYDDNVKGVKDSMAIMSYTYRPLYPIAFKTEYQFHQLKETNKFMLSFSVLF